MSPPFNGGGGRWTPSRRTQALEWYLRSIMRYCVGGGTIGWELIVDKGRNPLTLLVGAMLASSTDVLGLVRGLIAQARLERRTLEELVAEEQAREARPTPSGDGTSP